MEGVLRFERGVDRVWNQWMYAVDDVGGGKDKGCKTQAGLPSRQGES